MSMPPEPSETWSALAALATSLSPRKYLHISFHMPETMSRIEAEHRIQPIINTANDWIKYADNCWIVWTDQMPHQWYEKFIADSELKNKCSLLILQVNLSASNRSGQLPKWAWEWIDKTRY